MNVKNILIENNCSLAASNGYISYENGIRPILDRISEDRYYFRDLIVADKIIGKAAAMLLCYSGVKEVYALTLSQAGKAIFEAYNVIYHYDELIDHVTNRTGDDMCPMEKTVWQIDDLEQAYEALRNKIAPQ